ncbi:GH32 C-terminal domain-containing protein [uncultured Corynebacterium sp.]|uniref:GH32 C-terminal domain-containing protein n=1 Tax=uncultured Corynebacterium sp. TaxID=159447 RepID=UPI0025CFC5F7|nr:GH32 C-terminal domain-containing protein [uncultured Corynebacterium sp.]
MDVALDTLARRVHLVYAEHNGAGHGYRSAPWTPGESLTLFLDEGSLEVFIGEGKETLSSLDFAREGPRSLSVHTVNGPANVTVEIAPLKR